MNKEDDLKKEIDDDRISFQTSICPYCCDDHNNTDRCKDAFKKGKETERKEILEIIKKLINSYLYKEKKITLDITKEWKTDKSTGYPKIYSNQYYAFTELKSFWNNLNKQIKEKK